MSEPSERQRSPQKRPRDVSQSSDPSESAGSAENRLPSATADSVGPSSPSPTALNGHGRPLGYTVSIAEEAVPSSVQVKNHLGSNGAVSAAQQSTTAPSAAVWSSISAPPAAGERSVAEDGQRWVTDDGEPLDGSPQGLELLSAVAVAAARISTVDAAGPARYEHEQTPSNRDQPPLRSGTTAETRTRRYSLVRASWPSGTAKEDTHADPEDAGEDDLRTSEERHCSAPELNQDARSSTTTLSSDSHSLTTITDESFADSDSDASSADEVTVREVLPTGTESLLATGEDSSERRSSVIRAPSPLELIQEGERVEKNSDSAGDRRKKEEDGRGDVDGGGTDMDKETNGAENRNGDVKNTRPNEADCSGEKQDAKNKLDDGSSTGESRCVEDLGAGAGAAESAATDRSHTGESRTEPSCVGPSHAEQGDAHQSQAWLRHTESIDAGVSQSGMSHSAVSHAEQKEAELTLAESSQADVSREESSQAGLSQVGPSGTRPGLVGRSHVGPSHTGPSHAGPSHAGPSRTGPSHAGPNRTGSSHAEPSHPGPSHTGSSCTGLSHTGPSHAMPSHPGPSHPGPSHPGPSHSLSLPLSPSGSSSSSGDSSPALVIVTDEEIDVVGGEGVTSSDLAPGDDVTPSGTVPRRRQDVTVAAADSTAAEGGCTNCGVPRTDSKMIRIEGAPFCALCYKYFKRQGRHRPEYLWHKPRANRNKKTGVRREATNEAETSTSRRPTPPSSSTSWRTRLYSWPPDGYQPHETNACPSGVHFCGGLPDNMHHSDGQGRGHQDNSGGHHYGGYLYTDHQAAAAAAAEAEAAAAAGCAAARYVSAPDLNDPPVDRTHWQAHFQVPTVPAAPWQEFERQRQQQQGVPLLWETEPRWQAEQREIAWRSRERWDDVSRQDQGEDGEPEALDLRVRVGRGTGQEGQGDGIHGNTLVDGRVCQYDPGAGDGGGKGGRQGGGGRDGRGDRGDRGDLGPGAGGATGH